MSCIVVVDPNRITKRLRTVTAESNPIACDHGIRDIDPIESNPSTLITTNQISFIRIELVNATIGTNHIMVRMAQHEDSITGIGKWIKSRGTRAYVIACDSELIRVVKKYSSLVIT